MKSLSVNCRLWQPELQNFAAAAGREWLVTNGLGGFAAGTAAGACTRRYHGLLVAALKPPVQRTVLVAKLDVLIDYLEQRFALSSNEYVDGTVDPHGYRYLETFELEGLIPVWTFRIADARLRQRVWMVHGSNTTYVSLRVERASAPLALQITPLCGYRDYHAHSRGGWPLQVDAMRNGCRIVAFDGATPYHIASDAARFEAAPEWYWGFKHRIESERGLDDVEDLFRPGRFEVVMQAGDEIVFVLSTEPTSPQQAAVSLARERRRQHDLLAGLPNTAPAWVRQLALAADQFIVARHGDGVAGRTVIAGYPWFSDWGRDTMIALPGLTLACGRFDVAREILMTFAQHVSDGMLPNRFPDAGEQPEYNTVDATLWYFHAVELYVRRSGDAALVRELFPVLASIVDWHLCGTRYAIRADADGLLRAGEPGVQLTWMDAKVGDWVVTPRIGKPVEINALWHRSLLVMSRLAERLDRRQEAAEYRRRAAQVAQAFQRRFWYGAGGYLFDVIDGPAGDDASLRPNQLFAVSLGEQLLQPAQAKSVVDVCARELCTLYGLRSLSPRDAAYQGEYRGGPAERDGRYHQGTVWAWLLGPFADAHVAVYGDPTAALAYLEPLQGHLRDACVGSISEIFDGDEPNAAAGCFAQAWSVSEVLRAWLELSARAHPSATQQIEVTTA